MTQDTKTSYAGMGLTRKQIAKYKKIDGWNADTSTSTEQFAKGRRFLNIQTKVQRNAYYESVVKWESEKYDRLISEATKMLGDPDVSDWKKVGLKESITSWQEQKANEPLMVNTLSWLGYAKQDFDAKLDKVADKLVSFGFCGTHDHMEVVDLAQTHNRGLDFYIECETSQYSKTEESFGQPKKIYTSKGRAFARLVWVSCYDKASHWRFICTKKA